MKVKTFLMLCAFSVGSLNFVQCQKKTISTAQNSATDAAHSVKADVMPAELKNSPYFQAFVGKKTPNLFKQVKMPKSDFSLVYVRIEKDNPVGTDPAEINAARMFVFDLKNKKVDEEKTKQLNLDLKAESDEANNCGGLASLDVQSFVANQEFVHLDQFFAPGMERTTCISKIIWDNMQQKIVVNRTETVTE